MLAFSKIERGFFTENDVHYLKVQQCHATGGPKILSIIFKFNNVAAEILNSASFIANISPW